MGQAALTLLLALIENAAAISAAMKQSHAEGREMNEADWAAIDARDNVAAAKQKVALERAKAEGR